MRKQWWTTALAMLIAGSAVAQEPSAPQSAEEKKEKVNVERVVTSNVRIVTLDENGNLVTEVITSTDDSAGDEGTKEEGQKAKTLSYTMKDGVLEIVLPDGSTKKVELSKLGDKASNGLIELNVVPHVEADGELRLETDIGVKELGVTLKGMLKDEIQESLKGLKAALKDMDEEEAAAIEKKITAAISKTLPQSQGKLLRLGRAAIVVDGEKAEVAEDVDEAIIVGDAEITEGNVNGGVFSFHLKAEGDGENAMRVFRVVRAGEKSEDDTKAEVKVQHSSDAGLGAVLEKLDQIMNRIDKLEKDVEALKKNE